MELLKTVFQLFIFLFIVNAIFKKIRKRNKNQIVRQIGKKISDFRKVSTKVLLEYHQYLSEQIQQIEMNPSTYEVYFFRALIAARLSSLLENEKSSHFFYRSSSSDLAKWTNYASYPIEDTGQVTRLRKPLGKNKHLMDTHDMVGEISNMKSFDEILSDYLLAKVDGDRDEKLRNQKPDK